MQPDAARPLGRADLNQSNWIFFCYFGPNPLFDHILCTDWGWNSTGFPAARKEEQGFGGGEFALPISCTEKAMIKRATLLLRVSQGDKCNMLACNSRFLNLGENQMREARAEERANVYRFYSASRVRQKKKSGERTLMNPILFFVTHIHDREGKGKKRKKKKGWGIPRGDRTTDLGNEWARVLAKKEQTERNWGEKQRVRAGNKARQRASRARALMVSHFQAIVLLVAIFFLIGAIKMNKTQMFIRTMSAPQRKVGST
ncbi:hypothetical protein BC940DRAFT_93733 [Gongronella butleri]|nr:hypothetical protein BC940DRAFT_93733 [Gongronella butleri]